MTITHQPRFRGTLPIRLLAMAASLHAAVMCRPVSISETNYQGRPQFVARSGGAEWWLDRAGGGFSRLIDREGRDWIAFSKAPLSTFPDSAAAGYRGIPNAVFGRDNPDAGAGHPGFDRCESTLAGTNIIRTASKSGRWAWTWTFTETHVRLRMEKVPAAARYWFLYEGPVAGRWSPATHYWGTDNGGPRRDRPDSRRQLFDRWQWAYFGDDAVPRVLFVVQHPPDELPDTLWYLGANDGGALSATNGMIVFGFGRGPGATPQLREPCEFALGFFEAAVTNAAGHRAVRGHIERLLR